MPEPQFPAPAKVPYKRIATEEAFATPEQLDVYRRIFESGQCDAGFKGLMGFYMSSPSERAQHIMRCLVDLDTVRLQHMDAAGVDVAVLSLTSPGPQVMDAATAVSVARHANDYLAEAIRRHPTRYAGMIAVAPQDPQAAAKEIERGVRQLGMNSVVINSHTQGQYLSDPKFWDIFAAAEAMDAPVYLHPNSLPPGMYEPFAEAGLDGAIYGFGVETGLHALRIITAGVFDRFPKLRMILGHMGEALPYWAYRVDYMHAATVRSQRYENMKPIKQRPSDYLRQNFYITNSGVAWPQAIRFAQEMMGVDRVMYAMDYPYQYAPDEVNILDQMDMPLEDKTRFFQTNAEHVFKLR
ncbi:amidohydrolase [Ramlibacter sp. AW1]|uniref:Amidohydrolase n=2 Tax=Ramlibacter aurantiacus TaxID=2801330 RepID=A0A936ZQY9_9BURK|nr:amidohydrolase family protein [Ramlibacter aurantiacus]MBL0419415.1 amidohydrolase [Ramlibacter aurantiacus]